MGGGCAPTYRLLKYVGKLFDDGNTTTRKLTEIRGLMIHRIAPSLGKDAIEIAASFLKTDKYEAGYYTGGKMPYTFVVLVDGEIQQSKAISVVTPHARSYNQGYVSIAVIGDFRKHTPRLAQYDSVVELCVSLVALLGRPLKVVGHTQLPEASADKDKACPGLFFPLQTLQHDIALETHNLSTIEPTLRGIHV